MYRKSQEPTRSSYFPWFAGLVFLFAILACNAPTWEEVKEPLDLPTLAPSPAPTEAPSAEDFYILPASGVKINYASSTDSSCPVDARMNLVVRNTNSVELTAKGIVINDHLNCTAGDFEETWIVTGKLNPSDQTITFELCNDGGFTAHGTMKLTGSGFSGEVSCFTQDGQKSVTLRVK